MSREIKFRAKRLNNNEFVIGYYLPMVYGYKHFIYLPLEYLNEHSRIEIDPKTLGQYTGLKDKDGKEIYEGDIVKLTIRGVKIENVFGAVKMIEGCWCIDDEKLEESIELKRANYGIELYGNIYKNPELLNKEGE